MSQELSLQHLLACLTDKDRYKGTQLYIQEVLRLNEQIYPLIDASITETLLQSKSSSMSRLLTLRFFKELIMTANFSLIDGLNEKIEEHLIEVAQYNKKSKEVNRGANYLSETYKLKNDAEMQKISSSYVLLTLQILTVMGKWYAKDEDGEQSRFVQYYRGLEEQGVKFPSEGQLNFFKKDDQQKFKKNYGKWYEHYLKYTAEGDKKQKPAGNVEQSKVEKKEQPQAQKQLELPRKQQQQWLIREKEKLNQQLKTEVGQYKKQCEQKDKELIILQQKLKEQIKAGENFQSTISQQNEAIRKLQQELEASVLVQKQEVKPQEIYHLIVNPPNNTDELSQQIDKLQEQLKQANHSKNQKDLEIQKLQYQLKSLSQKLTKSIQSWQQKQKVILELKRQNQLSEEQKMQPKIQASLVVLDQPKVGTKEMQEKQMLILKEQILSTKHSIRKQQPNLSSKLRDKLNQISEDEVVQAGHKRQASRSLKKTQSQHRLMMNQTMNTPAFKKINIENKLSRTAQSFHKHRGEGSKMVTVFPFIPNYFPPLPRQCLNFKQHCLNLQKPNTPFYQNQWIKVTLRKASSKKCFVQVYNKTSSEQKIRVVSTHPSFCLEGEKIKKVGSGAAGEYQLVIEGVDLNMRCPLISIILGTHGISLITTSTPQKVFHMPLPLTLLDIIKINKPIKRKVGDKTIRFGANRFNLSSKLPNIEGCLPTLSCQVQRGEILRTGQIDWDDWSLRVEIFSWSRQVSLGVEFADGCQQIMSLGKVLLQILMYLLQE